MTDFSQEERIEWLSHWTRFWR